MSNVITDNLKRVQDRIGEACARVGRSPDGVTIVAVTKTHGAETVNALLDAGVTDIGENRMQEFLAKRAQITKSCRWHLVGALQSNKATKAIGQFAMIHAIDRLKIAKALSRLGKESDWTTRILLEVNTTRETTKHGFAPEDTPEMALAVAELPNLQLEGLMTMGPLTDDETAIRRSFQSLFRLKEKLDNTLPVPLTHLSMGMSDDFDIAVEEGATLLRLGRALVGERRP